MAARWRRPVADQIVPLAVRAWVVAMVAALALGYSSRLAFACNVGAFYSGISTSSLHGWTWFPAAFAGALVALRLRPLLGRDPRSPAAVPATGGAS